jgi:hypothetical protein
MEGWLLSKADRAFRAQISQAVLAGDGFGKPMGILNPAAGIPIYETADAPSPGQFTWQDLVALRWQIPQSFQDAGAYMMKFAHLGAGLHHVGHQRSADHDDHARRRCAVPHRRHAGRDRATDAGRCPRLDAGRLRQLAASIHGGEPQSGDDAAGPVQRGLLRVI